MWSFGSGRQYATGIEIGTSKICVVIAEVSKTHPFRVLGVGQSISREVRKGSICDTEQTCAELREAIVEAEDSANVSIGDVCIGITGGNIHSVDSVSTQVVESGGIVSEEDVINVYHTAEDCRPKEVRNGMLLHRVPQPFILDDTVIRGSPVGLSGDRLCLPMHWIYGAHSNIHTVYSLLREMRLEPKYPVFNGFALACFLKDDERLKQGGLILDMGAGTTEYVFLQKGVIRHAGVLTIGGDHVSNDLALGLKLEINAAENLKISHGRAIRDPQAANVQLAVELRSGERRSVRFDHMQLIMELRLKETFRIIRKILQKEGLRLSPDQVVMICGGGACIPLIEKLASSVFQVNVIPYAVRPYGEIPESLKKPQFATPLALAIYCAGRMSGEKKGPLGKLRLLNFWKSREEEE